MLAQPTGPQIKNTKRKRGDELITGSAPSISTTNQSLPKRARMVLGARLPTIPGRRPLEKNLDAPDPATSTPTVPPQSPELPHLGHGTGMFRG
ncbi:hypothetical protein RhiTH_011594 [Rhizoctonia solani]